MELAQENRLRSKHTLFYWMLAIMLCMVFARNVLHIEFSVYLFLLPVIVIAFVGQKDDIIAISIACMPLSTAFQYKYALFICIIFYCVRFSKSVKISAKVVPILLMFFWEMLHFGIGDFSWIELLRSFAELIFLAFLFCVTEEEFDMSVIIRTLSFATVFICLCVVLVQLEANSYDFGKLFSGTLRFGAADKTIENFGLNFNENVLGGICNISIVGTLLISDSGKMRVFDVISICFLAVFGTMTMSRTFIVCFAIIIIYYFAFQTGGFDRKVARVVGIIIIAIISFVLLYTILPQVIEKFIARFTEDDITNGRDELFRFYNEHIFSSANHTFFGIGLQDVQGKITEIHNRVVNSCHNGYQELLLVWGIPGFAFFLGLLVSIFSKVSDKPIERKMLQYGPVAILLILIIVGQFITNGIALLELAFAYLCIHTDFKKQGSLLWKEKE